MGDVLVYTDPSSDPERLIAWARPIATAAGGQLVALVAGAEPGASQLTGADLVLELTHPTLAPYLPEAHQAALVAAIEAREPDVVMLENTTAGYDLAAAAAAATQLPLVGYCMELALAGGQACATSAVYGGQLLATTNTSLPAVFAVNPSALHETSGAPGRGERILLPPPAALDSLRSTFVEAVVPADEGVDLTKAERIVCVGRGIGGADNIEVAQELAEALGADLAGTRPVIQPAPGAYAAPPATGSVRAAAPALRHTQPASTPPRGVSPPTPATTEPAGSAARSLREKLLQRTR